MVEPEIKYLEQGEIIHWEGTEVTNLASSLVDGKSGPRERATALFYWVRDGIKYNPYSPFFLPEHYWPATTLARGEGYCVQKAALLVAMARWAGIPARLVHADIINHRITEKMKQTIGSNLFVYHAYAQLFLEGAWVGLTPAFDERLCEELEIYPVEFDGRNEAMFHRLDRQGRLHIEYVRNRGAYADVPLGEILAGWEQAYSKEKVELWKKGLW